MQRNENTLCCELDGWDVESLMLPVLMIEQILTIITNSDSKKGTEIKIFNLVILSPGISDPIGW